MEPERETVSPGECEDAAPAFTEGGITVMKTVVTTCARSHRAVTVIVWFSVGERERSFPVASVTVSKNGNDQIVFVQAIPVDEHPSGNVALAWISSA